MKVYGSSLRMLSWALLLLAAAMTQEAHGLNAVVNYNEQTMWLYNYFRAYLCDSMFPEAVCDSLALAGGDEGEDPATTTATATPTAAPTAAPTATTAAGSNGGSGGLFGLGILGARGGGVPGGGRRRQRRNLRA